MRVSVIAFALVAAVACGPRQVEVRTAPPSSSSTQGELAVLVSNSLSQAINVSVTAAGSSELFLKQVPANTVQRIPVQGVKSGTTVTFKAVTVDGSRTYTSRSVQLTTSFPWMVP